MSALLRNDSANMIPSRLISIILYELLRKIRELQYFSMIHI
nr:MAG TPA: hypothetical protein [Caudoviricetes sp.]DAR72243.1 MAG TPA: hypothetical protein [Caudoviricetes sp.]